MSTSHPRSVLPQLLRASWRQARTTLVRKYTSASGIGSMGTAVFVIAIIFVVRNMDLGDDVVGAGAFIFAGFLAFGVVAAAVIGVAAELQTEREDGTLLRAKAIPHGMSGHLLAKVAIAPVDALIPILPMVIGALVLIPGSLPSTVTDWVFLLVLFLLTVIVMLPWGAILGSVFRSMMGMAWAMMGLYAVAIVSGLFFPVTILPTWAQWLVQGTPIYWIGHAFRAVMLPEEAGALEVAGEFRLGLALLILAGWAVLGMVLAPMLLRRMARRQSGSTVAAARDRVLSRGY